MDGSSADAKLSKIDPEPGRRWFATAFGSQKMNLLAKVGVIAYDEAGKQVATGSQG